MCRSSIFRIIRHSYRVWWYWRFWLCRLTGMSCRAPSGRPSLWVFCGGSSPSSRDLRPCMSSCPIWTVTRGRPRCGWLCEHNRNVWCRLRFRGSPGCEPLRSLCFPHEVTNFEDGPTYWWAHRHYMLMVSIRFGFDGMEPHVHKAIHFPQVILLNRNFTLTSLLRYFPSSFFPIFWISQYS